MKTTAKTVSLSARLKSIAMLVSHGSRVADIGTDHAYLPIYLCQRGISPSAIAADLRSGPLEAALANIRAAGLEDRIRIRRSDGLSAFRYGEADTLVMAGMGGKLICRILADGYSLLPGFREMLLQPQSDIEDVRRFLAENCFCIADEVCTEDEGKFYPVIRALSGKPQQVCYNKAELAYGPCLLSKKDPVLKKWLFRRQAAIERICSDLYDRQGGGIYRRLSELEEEKHILYAALKYYEM